MVHRRTSRFLVAGRALCLAALTAGVLAGSPSVALALLIIDAVTVIPGAPETSTEVTIQTDFTSTSGVDAINAVVTQTAGTVVVDIFVDVNPTAVISSFVEDADAGAYPAGPVSCTVNLWGEDPDVGSPPLVEDTETCDYVVTPSLTPALGPGALLWLALAVLATGGFVAGRGARRRRLT